MTLSAVVSKMELEHKLFAATAAVSGVLTALVFTTAADLVQVLLFASFTAYLAGAAYPDVDDYVPEFKRTGAMALGGVGLLAALAGTDSLLPLLFVLGGVLALFRLI